MTRTLSRLVLIDGNNLAHRAFHALSKDFTTSKGEIVNAVYGFTRMLLKVIKDLKPEYLIVAFDKKGPTFRHQEYTGYKAKRPEMDSDLVPQIKRIHEVVESLNIPIFELDGYEADDVIGTLAKQAEKRPEFLEIMIVTGDRDALQLVSPRIKIYSPKKGLSNPVIYDPEAVRRDYGLTPAQIVDFKALRGDPSDNIPGVYGIGEKTAAELIKTYGTLEQVYRNLAEISPSTAKKLAQGAEQAGLSKRLATIVLEAPIRLDLKACRLADYDQERARKFFEELEFKSLLDQLPGEEKDPPAGGEDENQMRLLI